MSRKAMKQIENPTSKPSIRSKAESQLDKVSTNLSIQTSQTASAYGRMTVSHKVRRPEVIKRSEQDLGSSASADKSNVLKLHGIQGRKSHSSPQFESQKQSLSEDTYPDKNEDYICLIQQLDRIRKENDRLIKLMEHQTEIGELPEKYKSDPVLLQTIKIEDGEEKKTINGLAILDKDLFAVSQASSEVEVYDSIKYIFSRRWNLRNLIAPKDIGSCSVNKCLYILDFKGDNQSKEILRVDPNGKLLGNWSTGSEWADCLSVTDESNVILAVFHKNKLTEYSPVGLLIREINLSPDAGIRNPFHAIKLSNGDFIVSHGDYGLNTVCVVDAVGKPKKPLCEKCKLFIGEMNGSLHLSVDGNGFVMIADRDSNRVLLLDSDLEFKREILSERRHGLQYPERILLDESSGRLFVAYNDWKKGRILVFQFK